jgi:hypothetical protein
MWWPTRTIGSLGFFWRVGFVYLGLLVVMPFVLLSGALAGTHAAGIVLLGLNVWAWFCLHANRLRDSGRRPMQAAVPAAVLFFMLAVGYVALGIGVAQTGGGAAPAPQPHFATGGFLEDPLPAMGGLEWAVMAMRPVLSLFGPAVAFAIAGLMMAASQVALIPAIFYSVLVGLRPHRDPLPAATRRLIQRVAR